MSVLVNVLKVSVLYALVFLVCGCVVHLWCIWGSYERSSFVIYHMHTTAVYHYVERNISKSICT